MAKKSLPDIKKIEVSEDKINLVQRIPRVKELLMQSHVMTEILHD